MVTNQRKFMIGITFSLDCLSPLDFTTVLSMPSINTFNYRISQWATPYIKSNRKCNAHKRKEFLPNKNGF